MYADTTRAARRALLAAALAAAILWSPLEGSAARAQGVDQTCPLALTRLEPTTTNALLLDTHAVYWVVSYAGAPGTRIRISGEFPHARYFSFNAYDTRARPADALTDADIAPDPASSNPFRPGADRRTGRRGYSAFVEFGPRPAHPAANTLYTGQAADGSVNYVGSVWYRVYLPDRGRDQTGGVGLPRLDLERSGSAAAAGPAPDLCSHLSLPTANAVNQFIVGSNGPPPLPLGGYPGRTPPKWRLFTSFGESLQEILVDNQNGDQIPRGSQSPIAPNLGFFSDRNTAYVYAPTSRGFGSEVVIRGRAPSFPDTRPPAPLMASGRQVRYFSFCQYDPLSQRVIDCRSDDEIPLDRSGSYTVVVSTPADRPANARPACGVAWVAWGPQSQGLLLYRQLLAAAPFAQAIARVGTPGNERAAMGPYYPAASYLKGRAAFEARGCHPGPPAKRAASRRHHGTRHRRGHRSHSHPRHHAAARFTG